MGADTAPVSGSFSATPEIRQRRARNAITSRLCQETTNPSNEESIVSSCTSWERQDSSLTIDPVLIVDLQGSTTVPRGTS